MFLSLVKGWKRTWNLCWLLIVNFRIVWYFEWDTLQNVPLVSAAIMNSYCHCSDVSYFHSASVSARTLTIYCMHNILLLSWVFTETHSMRHPHRLLCIFSVQRYILLYIAKGVFNLYDSLDNFSSWQIDDIRNYFHRKYVCPDGLRN